jgi:D-glycero-D-manno-heptose 1,7-bisphosphate phosphatase
VTRRAIFLDRDGVLIRDLNGLIEKEQIVILDGVGAALQRLKKIGFLLFCVSNQTVLARQLISSDEFELIQQKLVAELISNGAPLIDRFYYCFHHPKAQRLELRKICDCRKPKPGMLFSAARDFDLDLSRSFMIGDRMSDIEAGFSAGCRTVLVRSNMTMAARIETDVSAPPGLVPNYECSGLVEAADWILEVM